jgi:hypothetical protein
MRAGACATPRSLADGVEPLGARAGEAGDLRITPTLEDAEPLTSVRPPCRVALLRWRHEGTQRWHHVPVVRQVPTVRQFILYTAAR